MIRFAVCACTLALAIPASAEESGAEVDASDNGAATWRAVDAETGQIRDVAGLSSLSEDFPDSGSVRLRLLNAQIGEGDFEAALITLGWLRERGYVFSETAQRQIPKLIGEDNTEAAQSLLIGEAEVIDRSEVVAVVPAEAGLIESVLVPTSDEVMVATSVTGNSIHILAGELGWTELAIPGANDLSGVVSEPDDSIGWLASANIDGSEDETELFTGLIGLAGDPDNPIFVPAPEGVSVSDLTISGDATVYASDPQGGGIYAKPVAATVLNTVVPPGTFRSPQGLALSEDGALLYVSDYRYGLAIVDITSGAVSRLVSDVPAILDGVDGLWRHGNELIAMQNGTSPMRISALTLSKDGRRIIAVRTLEQANPNWTEPLGGSIARGSLYYVATGQWDRFVKGRPAAEKPAMPTEIRRIKLDVRPD